MKVLSLMVENPGREFLGSEIQKATKLSRAGVYVALRDLIRHKLAVRTHKGKFLIYSIANSDPVVKQFKVLKNVNMLKSIVEKLTPVVLKIVLFGSASRGEDGTESDIDLFILAKDKKSVEDILATVKSKRNIQPVIKVPSEMADFKEKEKIFYAEVDRGSTLFEAAE